ncbi:MAG: hypothetical protein WDZ83_16795 [Rhizobiaceae bacterium]
MKRMMRLTTAALFGATMLATPALAQTASGDVEVQVPETGETSIDTGTTAAVGTDFDSALGLMADSSAAAAINTMTDIGEIRVIHVSTLENSDEVRVEQAMAESEAQMQELHAAIDGNAAVKSQLEAQSVATTDVLAADVAADGGVIVYVR